MWVSGEHKVHALSDAGSITSLWSLVQSESLVGAVVTLFRDVFLFPVNVLHVEVTHDGNVWAMVCMFSVNVNGMTGSPADPITHAALAACGELSIIFFIEVFE